MHITVLMVLTYIACCVRLATAPWKYFQLNARYFSERLGVFSKLDIDSLIPKRWRLAQRPLDEMGPVAGYPVFLKPEWGQNAHGILRADHPAALERLRSEVDHLPQRYLLQQAAREAWEYEIFLIDAPDPGRHVSAGSELARRRADARARRIVTVTRIDNARERFPINSKNNRDTRYVDITDHFDARELDRLAAHVHEIGQFGIARMSARADSIADLLAGRFHVIEVNLYLPMPINLLDARRDWAYRLRFIGRAMMALAYATRAIEPVARPHPIFSSMMRYGRRGETRRRVATALDIDHQPAGRAELDARNSVT